MLRFIKRRIEKERARRAAEEAAREEALRIAREEEKARIEKQKIDNFYGCTEDGKISGPFFVMELRTIGVEYKDVEKKYILCDIDKLKSVTINRLMNAWMGTGKAEWEFMMAYNVMAPIRASWHAGKNEADITKLFQMELIAYPTGDEKEKLIEKGGNVYRVFDQEDIRNKVLKLFTINKTDEDNVYLTMNVGI